MITLVFPHNIIGIWEQVAPLLEPALGHFRTHDIGHVRNSLLAGNAQLWVQWEDKVEAAVTSEMINYPKGIWLRIWLAGASKGAKVDWQEFYKALVGFAFQNQCAGIEDCGRAGWTRHAPHAHKEFVMRRIAFEGEN